MLPDKTIPLRTLVGCVFVLSACGCGNGSEDGNGVYALIKLKPDPDVSTEWEVAEQVARMEMLFDAENGFVGINEADPKAEDFLTPDVDDDGQVELLLVVPMKGKSTLPTVRLDPGDNLSRRIAIRARGLDGEEVVAYGGIDPRVLFIPGGVSEVEVPFNLTRARLAPRIVALAPLSLPVDVGLTSVAFYSSKELDPSSLTGRVHVRLTNNWGTQVEVQGDVYESPRSCPYGTQMWVFKPSSCHGLGSYKRVEVILDNQVTDLEGTPIQDEDGTPGFGGALDFTRLGAFGPCTLLWNRCEDLSSESHEQRADVVCNAGTGLFEPAACSIAPGGCPGEWDVFTWLHLPDCQKYRSGAFNHGDACVIDDPWPCGINSACEFVDASSTCVADQCVPVACTDTCAQDSLVCVPEKGCLPRFGMCAEDCRRFGGCPQFEQNCAQVCQ